MSKLYHGSFLKGITRLEPRKSTHGDFVYATPYKELAIIFSARCGDDCTYALYRNSSDEPFSIVERIPGAFDTMFSNSSSIYSLDDSTFKDIHTGFSEVVSEVGVDVIDEEYLSNVYDAVKRLSNEGKIRLYSYPNKPLEIPSDSSDLIDKQISQNRRNGVGITRECFERLILLHPYLIDKVNQKIKELNLNVEPFKKEDLISLFESAVIKQAVYPELEQYLDSIVISISQVYPELLPFFDEKKSFINKSKNDQVSILIDKVSSIFPYIPNNLIQQSKNIYFNDSRSFSEIGKEIFEFLKKVILMEQIVNKPINQEILDDSILLIGPMGVGKSTISKNVCELTGLPRISLDDRNFLVKFYKDIDNFKNFKDFEFYLTSSVLTSLVVPSIIDFGGGHSVYENPIMFFEFQKLMSKFKNVFLILPSENVLDSIKILNERVSSRGVKHLNSKFETNAHFIKSPCNYKLATDIIYTYDMSIDEIANRILFQVQSKNDQDFSKKN